jgi:hypothetical protein
MTPICGCGKVMKCMKTGFKVGSVGNENWVYNGDKFACSDCGSEVVVFPDRAEGFEHDPDMIMK